MLGSRLFLGVRQGRVYTLQGWGTSRCLGSKLGGNRATDSISSQCPALCPGLRLLLNPTWRPPVSAPVQTPPQPAGPQAVSLLGRAELGNWGCWAAVFAPRAASKNRVLSDSLCPPAHLSTPFQELSPPEMGLCSAGCWGIWLQGPINMGVSDQCL